ncbi:MAG: hypothetical protein PQJ46_03410 [Spirochaetales bacterium]|nr:hypothetical protein [Spirochaetales bacterium]
MSDENRNIDNIDNQDDEISLMDLVAVIAKRWRFIFITTAIAVVFILSYSVYTKKADPEAHFNKFPDIYCPEVVVRLQDSSNSSSSLSSLISSVSGSSTLSNLLTDSTGSSSNAELAQALIIGNTIVDQLAKEMNFADKYKFKEFPVSSARKMIRASLVVDYDSETGLLTIGYEDINPVFATKVVNRALDLLEKRFRELTMDNVSSQRVFLEDQLAAQEQALSAVQDRLVEFMRKNGIVDIEAQTAAQVEEISQINSELVTKEVQLKNLKKKRLPSDPEVQQLEEDIEILRQLVKGMTFGFNDFGSPSEDIPQAELPKLAAEYQRLKAEAEMQTELYISFRTQFESVKLNEADNSKQFQIIERAEVPEMKAKPSRAKICLIFTIAVMFISIFATFVMEYFEKIKADPVESKKLKEIKQNLRLKK